MDSQNTGQSVVSGQDVPLDLCCEERSPQQKKLRLIPENDKDHGDEKPARQTGYSIYNFDCCVNEEVSISELRQRGRDIGTLTSETEYYHSQHGDNKGILISETELYATQHGDDKGTLTSETEYYHSQHGDDKGTLTSETELCHSQHGDDKGMLASETEYYHSQYGDNKGTLTSETELCHSQHGDNKDTLTSETEPYHSQHDNKGTLTSETELCYSQHGDHKGTLTSETEPCHSQHSDNKGTLTSETELCHSQHGENKDALATGTERCMYQYDDKLYLTADDTLDQLSDNVGTGTEVSGCGSTALEQSIHSDNVGTGTEVSDHGSTGLEQSVYSGNVGTGTVVSDHGGTALEQSVHSDNVGTGTEVSDHGSTGLEQSVYSDNVGTGTEISDHCSTALEQSVHLDGEQRGWQALPANVVSTMSSSSTILRGSVAPPVEEQETGNIAVNGSSSTPSPQNSHSNTMTCDIECIGTIADSEVLAVSVDVNIQNNAHIYGKVKNQLNPVNCVNSLDNLVIQHGPTDTSDHKPLIIVDGPTDTNDHEPIALTAQLACPGAREEKERVVINRPSLPVTVTPSRPMSGVDTAQTRRTVVYVYDDNYRALCDKMLRIPHRASMVHLLIESCGLLKHLRIIPPRVAKREEVLAFHSETYVDVLERLNGQQESEEYDEDARDHGIGYDCPAQEGVYDYALTVSGATMTAAQCLMDHECQVAINWFGGWHHAKRDEASGFCYLNDIVLGILRLREKYQKVLYIDLDLHHGDGVEEAFSATSKVFTLSFHKYSTGFFPGTGSAGDVGVGKGQYFSLNVPLLDGIKDEDFFALFSRVAKNVLERYSPEVVVCQCGADGLAGDPMDSFNLTHLGLGRCVYMLLQWKLPLLLLGGGGYNHVNTAKCWAFLTGLTVGKKLPADVPDHAFFTEYGPSYEMGVSIGNRPNLNNQLYLRNVYRKALGLLHRISNSSAC